ncbi:MAG: hypothetical protein GXY83_36750 [Rhodopirellula sp.]|nr:hypothetical protein [Rhodopirellula sp.]
MPKREYDPLSVIPSAAIVRKRLEAIQEQARKLGILLRTAEEIEQEQHSANTEGQENEHD